jgi:hypothetical protein
MAVESAADRAAFVNADEFGATATYTHGATTVSIDGIFDAASAIVADGDGLQTGMESAGILTTRPNLLVREADLPSGADEDDEVTIGSTDYRVAEIRPDGTGMALLILEST